MKWTTIEYIKEHSRLDYDCESALLELYADAAEETILSMCARTYEDFIADYGCIPPSIRQATLMLVDHSYMQRSPVSVQNLYTVPYAFEILIKPYVRLAMTETSAANTVDTIVLGSDFKLVLPVEIDDDDDVTLSDLDFTVVITNNDQKDKSVTIDADDCTVDDDDNTITVVLNSEDLDIGLLMAKVTLQIPDEDFPNSIRRDVQKVNPYTRIIG